MILVLWLQAYILNDTTVPAFQHQTRERTNWNIKNNQQNRTNNKKKSFFWAFLYLQTILSAHHRQISRKFWKTPYPIPLNARIEKMTAFSNFCQSQFPGTVTSRNCRRPQSSKQRDSTNLGKKFSGQKILPEHFKRNKVRDRDFPIEPFGRIKLYVLETSTEKRTGSDCISEKLYCMTDYKIVETFHARENWWARCFWLLWTLLVNCNAISVTKGLKRSNFCRDQNKEY